MQICDCSSNVGKTVEVASFISEYESLSKVPVVDVAMQFGHPKTGEIIVLTVKSLLHVTSIDHNLIPHFMLSEAGVEVNPVPKMRVDEPSPEDHLLYFKDEALRTLLDLAWCIFLFSICKPITQYIKLSKDKSVTSNARLSVEPAQS